MSSDKVRVAKAITDAEFDAFDPNMVPMDAEEQMTYNAMSMRLFFPELFTEGLKCLSCHGHLGDGNIVIWRSHELLALHPACTTKFAASLVADAIEADHSIIRRLIDFVRQVIRAHSRKRLA